MAATPRTLKVRHVICSSPDSLLWTVTCWATRGSSITGPVDESAFEGWVHPNMRPKAPCSSACAGSERRSARPVITGQACPTRSATANRTEQIRAPTTFRTRPAAQLMRESSAVATLGSGGDNSAPPGAVRGAAARPGAAGGAPAITHRPRACGEWSATDRSAGLPTGAAGAPPIPTTRSVPDSIIVLRHADVTLPSGAGDRRPRGTRTSPGAAGVCRYAAPPQSMALATSCPAGMRLR